MRQLVKEAAGELRRLSDTEFEDFPNVSAEYGAFIIRGAGGAVRMSDPFTSRNSENIDGADISNSAVQSMSEGDTLIGFVHTHMYSEFASEDDVEDIDDLLVIATGAAGANKSPWLVNYIVGPEGGVNEYTSDALSENPSNARDLETAMESEPC